MRQPQTEEITFYPYPEYKPPYTHGYLITRHIKNPEETYTTSAFWREIGDIWEEFYDPDKKINKRVSGVIAWAHMPKGYKES